MQYQWLLFDADETLFDYPSLLGLQQILAPYHINFNQQDYQEFQAANRLLWQALQNGEINMQELAEKRFAKLAKQTGEQAHILNHQLQLAMAKISQPLPFARELLQYLKQQNINIGIITNGFAALQKPRLAHLKLEPFIDTLIISEEIGFAKPDKRIFNYALQQMNIKLPENVLMVGDSLSSDIIGAKNVGMSTCWFNRLSETNTSSHQPDFEIHHLSELIPIINQ